MKKHIEPETISGGCEDELKESTNPDVDPVDPADDPKGVIDGTISSQEVYVTHYVDFETADLKVVPSVLSIKSVLPVQSTSDIKYYAGTLMKHPDNFYAGLLAVSQTPKTAPKTGDKAKSGDISWIDDWFSKSPHSPSLKTLRETRRQRRLFADESPVENWVYRVESRRKQWDKDEQGTYWGEWLSWVGARSPLFRRKNGAEAYLKFLLNAIESLNATEYQFRVEPYNLGMSYTQWVKTLWKRRNDRRALMARAKAVKEAAIAEHKREIKIAAQQQWMKVAKHVEWKGGWEGTEPPPLTAPPTASPMKPPIIYKENPYWAACLSASTEWAGSQAGNQGKTDGKSPPNLPPNVPLPNPPDPVVDEAVKEAMKLPKPFILYSVK